MKRAPPPPPPPREERDVGGRILRFRMGEPKYDTDPYRGQRRRPWMCFRVGTSSPDFSNEQFVEFIGTVHKTVIAAGVLLDDQKHVLRTTCTETDYDYLKSEIVEGVRRIECLYDKGPLSVPIAILVLDIVDEDLLDQACSDFCSSVHFFTFNREEIMHWMLTKDLSELKQVCKDFANSLVDREGLVESLATAMPTEERVLSFGRDLAEMRLLQEMGEVEEDARQMNRRDPYRTEEEELELDIEEINRREANLRLLNSLPVEPRDPIDLSRIFPPPPPGLSPPGLKPKSFGGTGEQKPQAMLTSPPGLPGPSEPPGLSRLSSAPPPGLALPSPPGIPISAPPGIPAVVNRSDSPDVLSISSSSSEEPSRPQEEEEKEVVGDDIISYSDLQAALSIVPKQKRPFGVPHSKHQSELARMINGSKLYRRFKYPFVELNRNLELLLVLNYALASRAKVATDAAKPILRGAFFDSYSDKLHMKYMKKFFESGAWSMNAVELLFEMVMFYFNTARFRNGFMLTCNSFAPSWEDFRDAYHKCDKDSLMRIGITDQEFRNLDNLITHINKWVRNARNGSTGYETDTTLLDNSVMERTPAPSRLSHRHEERPTSSMFSPPRTGSSSNQDYNRQSTSCNQDYNRQSTSRRDEELEREERLRERERQAQELRRREEERLRTEKDARRREDYMISQERKAVTTRQVQDPRNRQDDNQRRRDSQQAGFHNGPSAQSDDGYPDIDISDSTDDAEDNVVASVEKDLPVTNTDEKAKQPYKYVDGYNDGYEPPWMKCEKIDPPEDFKTLTAVPTLKDYVNPTEPYLRRIDELGVYKSPQHYLDVQFRLLREDLVSPMRDGVDIYRRNGTCKGNRKPNEPCSDISIYNIERVDGKQVTERDGIEMRIIWPAQYDIAKLLDNDKEMKELGLVMLSCDRFVDDFHLGQIQQSYLTTKGCIHFAVFEETFPFKANTTYQMAQATSYLPSYKHVLQNLKGISPYRPLPFERYIVYGKKEIFRPNFHRHPKSAEQEEEESRLKTFYNNARDHAISKRFMTGKPVPAGFESDETYDFTQTKTSEITDLELLQLKEPIFREFVGVDTKGSDHIRIDKRWYKISRLLDDFHPTNMDESQRQAFCNTFKHELSIIQGPPGTGKTHIGVEIIKTMLQNRAHWRITEPILVVCFTNSGLDNLLERVYEMIENDEELSKDTGNPKMIRYGRKCDSEFLKRRNVMRYDVHDDYKHKVSDTAQREQSKAGAQKRKKAMELVLSSFTLCCSRNEILSYLILSRVMSPSHQNEINTFAHEHVDSKGNPLNEDEAVACWLLDRNFGEATKAQAKKAKKNKFQEMTTESDDEANQFLTVQDSDDDENDDEMDDEARLDKLFDKMNFGCAGKDILGVANGGPVDEYFTKGPWEIARENRPPEVILMGRKNKSRSANASVDEHINSLLGEVKEMILSTAPLTKEELDDVRYIFSLARPKRWALYITWCEAVRNLVVEGLPKQITEYRIACQRFQRAQDFFDAEIMKMPMIVGATTTGCSRLRPILECVEPRILIVEEAAEVLEAHILSAMISSIEHCVMIGDHKQLRPNPAVHELGTEYGMRVSMFERLVERALPYSQLREQHRMNLLISDAIVKPSFYDNVIDAENVGLYPDVEGMATNLYFWSHTNKEETPDGISWLNTREVHMTVALVKHLLRQNYTTQDIVVLATYSAQRTLMYREFPTVFGSSPDSQLIPVETVDSFQGRERKISIVSLVRSHRGVQENTGIGFLAVANRICVALTRAQHGMYIIGNGGYIMNNSKLWHQIVGQLDSRNLVQYEIPLKCVAHGNIAMCKNPDDIQKYSPEGGCLEMCNIQKECGHVCRRQCHPKIEIEHSARCEYPCESTCPNPKYNHKCTRMCYEECGNCMQLVELVLNCGHLITTPCSRISTALCDQTCTKTLQCGHRCPQKCGVECIDASECRQFVKIVLDCGHTKHMPCCDLTGGAEPDMRCIERCEKQMLTCQHQCKEFCGAPCTLECKDIVTVTLPCKHDQEVVCSTYMPQRLDLIKCETLVPKTLTPCGHTEMIACGQEPTTDLCTRPCTKIIKECNHVCADKCGKCFLTQNHICQQRCQHVNECGHNCGSKCGEKCPPCKAFCPNSCAHQGCGLAGGNSYGRECSALCALCTNHCTNKCIHRSCTKKCYEECNVKTCSEPCTEKLKCGHACLGMCGETCPRICGTCERQKYLDCVSETTSSSQRVHRLIQVPKCHHILPVELLDEHVKKLKEKGAALRCPKCNASLVNVLRYTKYTKKLFLDENMKKLNGRVTNVHLQTLETNLRNHVLAAFAELRNVSTNMSDQWHKVLTKFYTNIQWLQTTYEENKGKAEHKWRIAYLLDIARCFKAVALIVALASKQRVSSRKDIPPSIDTIIIQSFGNHPFYKILEELQKMNEHFADNGKTFMIGAVLPKMRLFIFKMAAYQLVSALINRLVIEKQNIPDPMARSLLSSCNEVLNGTDRQCLVMKLANIEKMVLQLAPKLENARVYCPWEMLGVPDF